MAYTVGVFAMLGVFAATPAALGWLQWASVFMIGFFLYGPQVGALCGWPGGWLQWCFLGRGLWQQGRACAVLLPMRWCMWQRRVPGWCRKRSLVRTAVGRATLLARPLRAPADPTPPARPSWPQMLIGLCGAELVGPDSVGASEGFLGWVAYLGEAPS